MEAETNRQLMLMIDGDNAQADLLPQMIAEVNKHGVIKIRRVYGNWESEQLKPWKTKLHLHGLKPEQQFSYTPGKNATDIALVIDAMDFIHTAGVDGICIVSSDSDYTPLATRIREKNLFVMGIGHKQTPRAFVNACDVFVHTENLKSVADRDRDIVVSVSSNTTSNANANNQQELTEPVNIEELFRLAFESTVQDDGWAHLGTLGSNLRQLDPSFDPRSHGFKLLSQLVYNSPDFFEVHKQQSENGNDIIYVRLKNY
jgi:uncharacterized LabA/DUF88 family protein